MKRIVYLIRHGEISNPNNVIYGRNVDLELSKKGIVQVKDLGIKLKNMKAGIKKIYTGPLKRTTKTAEILSKILGVKSVEIVKEITDSNVPNLAGKGRENMDKVYTEEFLKKGDESPEEISSRMVDAFKKILEESKDKTIAIIGHSDPLRFLLYRLLHPANLNPSKGSLLR